MVRVANTTRNLVKQAQRYIQQQINISNIALRDSEQLIQILENAGNFTQTNINSFKSDKIQEAKAATTNAVKMFRWMLGELSVTTPTAFTGTQVDAIDENIRTFEDGT